MSRPHDFILRPLGGSVPGELPEPLRVTPDASPTLIGRSTEADWAIADPTVSRRHASLSRRGDTWLIEDLGSRHGTHLNHTQLDPHTPTPLTVGDQIGLGTWRCRCDPVSGPVATTRIASPDDAAGSISVIPEGQLGGVAQRSLDALIELTATLDAAESREAIAAAGAQAVRRATGCRRVTVVEPDADRALAVLASTTDQTPRISRTLIERAAEQGLVQLTVTPDRVETAQSIIDLGIRSAICAAVTIDGAAAAFLTVDTRDAEGIVPPDAAAFCRSVAHLLGLALERISAAQMADRHRQLSADLDAARRAQELLSPPNRGDIGGVTYRFESIPGRVVAGDLFDIFRLDGTRVACFLGDVSGKGVGAAMLMAACQSQLRTRLLSGLPLTEAMRQTNADLHARTESARFITMAALVIDAGERSAELVDAGHGLALCIAADGATRLEAEPGFPLGVVDEAAYESLALPMHDGLSIMLLSDGAIEQPDAQGKQFGLEGVMACLSPPPPPDDAVSRVIAAVESHAPGAFADDLTAASIRLSG
ncbi:MAG: SpoIIE family protein phosphatase [Planctomycetota bacterium]